MNAVRHGTAGRAGLDTPLLLSPLPLLLPLMLLSLTTCCSANVMQPVLDILSQYAGDCSVLTFSNENISPWLRGLNRRQLSSMNFQFDSPLGTGRLPDPPDPPDPPPNTNYYAEVLRLPCLTHVFWGNISSLMGRTLRAVEEQKTVVIRREYFLLYDTTGSPPAGLFESLKDRPNVAVLSESDGADGAVRVTVRCLYCDGGRPRLYRAGRWTPETGLQMVKPIFFDQFDDFHGHQLTGSVLKFVPFVDYDEMEGGRLIPQPSVDINALEVMANKRNFTYFLREPTEKSWG